MTHALAYLNSGILAALSILHFYWAAGGRRGFVQAVPVDEAGNKVFQPGKMVCVAIGLALLGFSCYYLSKGIGRSHNMPVRIDDGVIWVLALIFSIRAIGDFRYVGFFKKIRNSEFGHMDTYWYTPLCLYLGLSSAWIGLNI